MDFFQAAKSARIQRAGLIPDDVCDYLLLSDRCKLVHDQKPGLYSPKRLIVLHRLTCLTSTLYKYCIDRFTMPSAMRL